ncbi:MAG: hypothetical protein RML56_06825 [Burkholderiales bacterium]|nr:hypothetical protein [Burkholderiales bacterium]
MKSFLRTKFFGLLEVMHLDNRWHLLLAKTMFRGAPIFTDSATSCFSKTAARVTQMALGTF